jgi:hypothetical protein
MVMFNWAWDYLFAERSVRLILPRRNENVQDPQIPAV